ncbi:DUF1479 domain protein [Rhodotorula toruloides]|uniref:DUF1479 domain protein n=1 Tax=Rhodotorula toruloides TaxID=5286 RepID=A0A511KKS5_RHOTO|nr:DUF1479 domain protein [Rhodotorula toruloides]
MLRPLSLGPRTLTSALVLRTPLLTRSISCSPTRLNPATLSEKDKGSIASVFSSLGRDSFVPLEPRFGELKKALFTDGLIESWRTVLTALEERTEEIRERGTQIVPQVDFRDLQAGLSPSLKNKIKRVGTVVVHGAVPTAEAEGWKGQIQSNIAENRSLARGFPDDNPQVWEIYNSVAQTQARTHPGLVETQKTLLGFFHMTNDSSPVSVNTPISYFDRLRIRFPGDSVFALGCHVDGGSLERWEDPGWTALSRTAPGEGTLQVFPDVNLATSYLILRPFFRERRGREGKLGFDDWEVDLDSSTFPGSVKGKAQELSHQTHPHLRLTETMVSVPQVVPGSQVYWHCDVIHAVESRHGGKNDSSVLYIPAAPLTQQNATYLAAQRARFEAGKPAPDFPGGAGESQFVGRAWEGDVHAGSGKAGLRALGYAPFVPLEGETEGGKRVINEANRILGFV